MLPKQNKHNVPSKNNRIIMLAQAIVIMAILPLTLKAISFLAKQAGLPSRFLSAQAVTLIAALCIILLLRSDVTMRQIGFKKLSLNLKNLACILGGTLAILLFDPLVKYGLAPVFEFEFKDYTNAYISRFEGDLSNYIQYMIFVVFLSAGIGEEILTRGFLFNRFEKAFSGLPTPWLIALFLQAIAFGLFHYNAGFQAMLITMVSGLILGSVYLLTGRNLIASISTHILVNSIYITSFFFGKGVFV